MMTKSTILTKNKISKYRNEHTDFHSTLFNTIKIRNISQQKITFYVTL